MDNLEITYHIRVKHEKQETDECPKYITKEKNDHPFDKSLIPEEYPHFPSDEIHLYNLQKLCDELNKIKKPFKEELGGLNSKNECIIFQENEWETQLCYIQGKYMENLTWIWDVPVCTEPDVITKVTYRKFTQNQLAHYLYWRTEFKKGHYIAGYRAYYYLFFYELTNGIGNYDKETTILYLNSVVKNCPYELYMFRWKSQLSLFLLTKKFFSDAILGYTPLWLGMQSLDIYIPSLKIGIEYQGVQHYESVEFFDGKESLFNRKQRDLRKKQLCQTHGVKLITWSYREQITEENVKNKIGILS